MSDSDSKNSTPPATLHELLSLALSDLALVEADPRYVVKMAVWHTPHQGTCYVCLAGSVMAKTLKLSPDISKLPHQISPEWNKALSALDFLRVGYIGLAAERFYGKPYYDLGSTHVSYYGEPEWRPNMEKLVQRLKELGL